MRRVTFLLVAVAIIAFGSSAEDKRTLIVTAVTHESRVNERTTYSTTPGQSTTDCSGTGTDSGSGTMRIRMDCDTTTTPAKTTPMTTRTTDVSEKVIDSENMVYTITCTDRPNVIAAAIVGAAAAGRTDGGGGGTLAGSGSCVPLTDGDRFEAEIKGTTMWVHALKRGNQGKAVKIKYKILDIRKLTPQANDQCQGDGRDTSEVWRLGRSLGEKDNEIAEAMQAHGVCSVLIYLHREADGKALPPQQPQAQAVSTAEMPLAATSPGQEAMAQSSARSKSLDLAKRFHQHLHDFLDFSRSHQNDREEYEVSMALSVVADHIAERLDSVSALFEVYQNILSSADRARIQPLIKSDLLRCSKYIERSIPELDGDVANTRLPAVASAGDRMKQDLRDAKAFLDSLQTFLE